jgi:predicted nucleic acid-binding protein
MPSVPPVIVLDSGPLGKLIHPRRWHDHTLWLDAILRANRKVVIPEIADYEVRRSLLRAGSTRQLATLDALSDALLYSPITTDVMRWAAQLWADVRRSGKPFAADDRLDGDAVLIAQVQMLGPLERVAVVTENRKHLADYVPAYDWSELTP